MVKRKLIIFFLFILNYVIIILEKSEKMSKKVFLITILTIFCCLFSINNVKATNGEGNIGTDLVICKYCKGTDCYFIVQNKKAPSITSSNAEYELTDNKDRQLIYKVTGQSVQKIELMYEEGWFETDSQWTLPYVENPSVCANHMYKVKYTQEEGISRTNRKTTDAFIETSSTETRETISKYIEPYTVFDDLLTHGDKVQDFYEYLLTYQYGSDYKLKDHRIPQLVENLVKISSASVDETPENNKGLYNDKMGCAVLTGPILDKLNWFFNIIKYGGAALAILLGAFDFFKAVMSDEDKSTKKAAERFLKRLIAAVLIFLLPLIIQFILNNVEIDGFNHDAPTCGVGVSESVDA